MNNIINIEKRDNCINVNVRDNDRGPKGDEGVGIKDLSVNENGELIAKLSDGSEINSGEMPMAKTSRIYVGEMDGIKLNFDLPTTVEADKVSYITINGVIYTTNFEISSNGNVISLDFPPDKIPEGRLEVVLNEIDVSNVGGNSGVSSVNGKMGEVVLSAEDIGALSDDVVIPSRVSELTNDKYYQTDVEVGNTVYAGLVTKQDLLQSGVNIKTINGNSILGNGNLEVSGNGEWGSISGDIDDQLDLKNALDSKQDVLSAGSNISIVGDEISAVDTTYNNFVGTDGYDDGVSGLVPAPTTSDDGKYLKSDGTWSSVSAGPTVVQTTGSSTTDVMSQDATTKMIFQDSSVLTSIRIGNSNNTTYTDTISIGTGTNSVKGLSAISIGQGAVCNASNCPIAIGDTASATSSNTVALGRSAKASGSDAVAIGRGAEATRIYSVALGRNAKANNDYNVVLGGEANSGVANYNVVIGYGAVADNRDGQVSFKKSSTYSYYGYNHTGYMLLAGVHDGIDEHDAVNLGQLDGRIKQNSGVPTTATVGSLGQLLIDITNAKLYQCSAIDTTDPNNPSYTWSEVGGGGGVNVVQTTGSSVTDVMSQDATTKMVFQGGSHPTAIRIGSTIDSAYDNTISIGLNNKVWGQGGISIGANATIGSALGNGPIAVGHLAQVGGDYGIAIGRSANASVSNTIAIGAYASTTKYDGIAIGGRSVKANGGIAIGGANNSDYGVASTAKGGVAIGFNSHATRAGEVNFGDCISAGYGFNNSAYRVLGGVYDGQDLHDAATVAQGNTLATSAPTTSTVGVLGQLYTDTTNMHTYQCTLIDTTDPDNPSYTWTQRW